MRASQIPLFSTRDRNFLFSDEQHWQLMLENIPAAIAVLDNELCYVAVTQRWVEDYQLQEVDILGKCHYEMFPDIPQRWKDIHSNCLKGNVDSCKEDPFPREDGGTVWISWVIQPWYLSDMTVGGIIMFTEVITAQKELEQFNSELERRVEERTNELMLAKERAEAANRAKSDFLSHMSHELRTPLNAILGYAELMESDPNTLLNEDQAENIDEILRAGRHLFSLIEEILDLSSIEAGKLSIETDGVSLNRLVSESLSMVGERARRCGIELHNDIKIDPTIMLRTDERRLRQILMNLLTNAIKYNKDKGSVCLNARLLDKQYIRLMVSDTGQGIPQTDLELIFQPFERSIQKHSQIEGSGIGLPLCQKLAEAMGCTMGVRSELDKGSEFWIDVPVLPD